MLSDRSDHRRSADRGCDRARVCAGAACRMKDLLIFYVQSLKTSVISTFQYRTGQAFYILGMMAEAVIYLVVWSTVVNAQGGSIAGYTAGGFAAYYIIWTLVRNINIVFTPYGWEWRIQRGELSGMLLRPLHPLHYDLSFFAGMKVVMITIWLPIAVLLTLVSQMVIITTFIPAKNDRS